MDLMTIKDVTSAVKVSESTVRRWVRSGLLPAYKVGDRGQLRFQRSDVLAFLNRHRVGPEGAPTDAQEGKVE